VVGTVLAGGVLAAVGQAALTDAMPVAQDGANVLKLGVQELLGTPTVATASVAAPLVDLAPAADPVAAEPTPVDVGELVKAAQLHERAVAGPAADAGARAPRTGADPVATPRVPDAAEAVPQADTATAAAGEVQMVTGRVTSGFGSRWGRAHRGLDVAAPIGTPIRAPLAGEVVASGPASGFGLWVRVRHDDGTVTTYGHVNRSLVHVGDQVEAGQKIAEVGNRGRSTGPHLHMEVQTPGGTTINPRPWLDGHGIGY
jgi:murein DD-endopeptidase MepM/ murein hydrolase activator NlpD